MKYTFLGICILFLASGTKLLAQGSDAALVTRLANGGVILTPRSGVVPAEDAATVAHTSFTIYVPPGRPEGAVGFSEEEFEALAKDPITGVVGESPATLACIYGLTAASPGCNPNTLTATATGGSKAIAIVSAFDYPTAMADLTSFAKYWGLPAPTAAKFTVTWPKTKPTPDPNCKLYGGNSCWAANSALLVDMAYSMAPAAHIYLVEAASSGIYDLYAAVKTAKTVVANAGGGEIVMGFGINESSIETYGDSLFTSTAPIVFFATASDGTYNILYPATSPNVVAVGGTSISRQPGTLNFQGELASELNPGGVSAYEARPSFQDTIKAKVGNFRGVPDVAAVSNVSAGGVWVYDSYENTYGGTLNAWLMFGGTAVSTSLVAGIVNNAGHFAGSSADELSMIYTNAEKAQPNPPMFYDITDGACGPYDGYLAVKGWDFCTGNGIPYGTVGK